MSAELIGIQTGGGASVALHLTTRGGGGTRRAVDWPS